MRQCAEKVRIVFGIPLLLTNIRDFRESGLPGSMPVANRKNSYPAEENV
jgi:hypothetical protein